jgi:hypothetical protein
MRYVAVIKKKFKIPEVVVVYAEDEMYAYYNLHMDYPKHKIIKLWLKNI